jgi:ABC-2 type transport system permease protein
MALFYTQTWGVWNFFESFVRLGQYPADIYSQKFVKIILYSLIPIAFLGTVPANMLRGEMKLGLLLAGLTVAIFFLTASRKFWLYSVRNYSSASS